MDWDMVFSVVDLVWRAGVVLWLVLLTERLRQLKIAQDGDRKSMAEIEAQAQKSDAAVLDIIHGDYYLRHVVGKKMAEEFVLTRRPFNEAGGGRDD